MHPFNLLISHVLEIIAHDYQVPIKIDDYLIKNTVYNWSLDDIIKVPQTPFPNALPLSRMKRPDLITELEHYGLSTEGTVSELKLRLKTNRILPPKTKRKKVTKPKDRIPPLHDHPPTDQLIKTCAFCDSHGNSLSTIGHLRSKATNLSGVEFHV